MSVGERLAVVAADTEHGVAVITAQAVAMKQNSTQSVPLDDVHTLVAEVAQVGCRRSTQDQRLGILQRHTAIPTPLTATA